MTDRFECVIGLEVHVQLETRTKLFCACMNSYGSPPNTNVCPVCTGQPGVLPVLNARALELAVRAGLALGCSVPERTKFDRKNYFYPDLPKGYQVSQFDLPVNVGGGVTIEGDDGRARAIGIVRAHLEEDAGKTMHPDGAAYSLVDLNRAGIPLLEIVSRPELRSPSEAHRYLVQLKQRLRYARVSDCDMEKGSLRCDANVSIRPTGDERLGTRVEIKNLNSFRNVERALAYEIARQEGVVRGGGQVLAETRTWREDDEATAPMRSKEEAEDYRYFPEPDLPEFTIPPAAVEAIRDALPEMPDEKERRYTNELDLPAKTAEALILDRDTADYFDACIATGAGTDPRSLANFVTGVVLALANERGQGLFELSLPPSGLCDVVRLVGEGRLSNQAARKVIPAMVETGAGAEPTMIDLGLEQVSDRDALVVTVDGVIGSMAQAVAEFRDGNEKALNALVGAVMKASRGKANPNLARDLLLERIQNG